MGLETSRSPVVSLLSFPLFSRRRRRRRESKGKKWRVKKRENKRDEAEKWREKRKKWNHARRKGGIIRVWFQVLRHGIYPSMNVVVFFFTVDSFSRQGKLTLPNTTTLNPNESWFFVLLPPSILFLASSLSLFLSLFLPFSFPLSFLGDLLLFALYEIPSWIIFSPWYSYSDSS